MTEPISITNYTPGESVETTCERFRSLGLEGNAVILAARQQRGDLFDEEAGKLYEYEVAND